MVALIDFERLAARYVQELHEEGISIHSQITASCVLADLCRLSGVPVPSVISEHDHEHTFSFDMPARFGECVTCGSLPF